MVLPLNISATDNFRMSHIKDIWELEKILVLGLFVLNILINLNPEIVGANPFAQLVRSGN